MIIALAATFLSAHPSQAADQAYNLYYADEKDQIEQVTGAQFTRIGKVTNGVLCAVTTDGKVWTQKSETEKPALNTSVDTSSCLARTVTDKYLPFRSNIWSTPYSYRANSTSSNAYLSIDADGYLWSSNSQLPSAAGNPQPAPARLAVKFHDGVSTNEFSNKQLTFLLGSDRSQANTTVAQMPTTGAPTGLSTAGLIAVGIGLMGVGFGLGRKPTDFR